MNPVKVIRDIRTISRLFADAERVAGRMGEEQPAAEHLLIAAIGLPDGTAARALGRFDVDALRLEAAVTEAHRSALVAAGVVPVAAATFAEAGPLEGRRRGGAYRATGSFQELFQAGAKLAREAREPLRGAHVVLAAAALEHGTVARAFDALGIERAELEQAARRELAGS